MQIFKDQQGWTHVFGSNYPLFPKKVHPLSRKTIHRLDKAKCNWQRISTGLRSLFQDYCSHSTIHGMSYIGSGRSAWERFWWLAVCVLFLYGGGILIQKTYQKWHDSPVIVSFDQRPTAVWKIPFPAVTICPEAKFNSDLINVTDAWRRYSEGGDGLDLESRDKLMAALQICDRFFHSTPQYYTKFTNDSIDVEGLLRNISIGVERSISECKCGRKDCTDSFYPTITDEGICFTFNGFSAHDLHRNDTMHSEYLLRHEPKNVTDWSMDEGYKKGAPLHTHPIRGSGYATRYEIKVSSFENNIDSFCRERLGFKLVLHSPDEYPMVLHKYIQLSLNRDITIAIEPHIIMTAEELRDYGKDRRQCLFEGERQLRFFRVYNQNNCEAECLTNWTLSTCGCVRFSMPRSPETRICSTQEINCVVSAELDLLEFLATRRIQSTNKAPYVVCQCMPACTSIQYHTEITQSTFNSGKTNDLRTKDIHTIWETSEKSQMSKITIFYKATQFITSRRSELFGMTEFIANCGGILGLCLGVSLFSLVELVYYVTVRLFVQFRKS